MFRLADRRRSVVLILKLMHIIELKKLHCFMRINLSFISKKTKKIVKKRLLDHLTSNFLLNPFQLPIPNSTLPRLHYFPYMTIFLMPYPCNKSHGFVFLIYQLPLILSTTPSYSIVFPPGSAFPLFHYNGSLHVSHPAHLL